MYSMPSMPTILVTEALAGVVPFLQSRGLKSAICLFLREPPASTPFSPFQATADSLASSSAILNGTVERFMADLDCETGGDVNYTIAFRPLDSKFPYYDNTSVTTKTCRVDNAYMDTPILGPTTNVSAGYFALVQPANYSDADPGRDDAHRLMVSIGYSRSFNVTHTGQD